MPMSKLLPTASMSENEIYVIDTEKTKHGGQLGGRTVGPRSASA